MTLCSRLLSTLLIAWLFSCPFVPSTDAQRGRGRGPLLHADGVVPSFGVNTHISADGGHQRRDIGPQSHPLKNEQNGGFNYIIRLPFASEVPVINETISGVTTILPTATQNDSESNVMIMLSTNDEILNTTLPSTDENLSDGFSTILSILNDEQEKEIATMHPTTYQSMEISTKLDILTSQSDNETITFPSSAATDYEYSNERSATLTSIDIQHGNTELPTLSDNISTTLLANDDQYSNGWNTTFPETDHQLSTGISSMLSAGDDEITSSSPFVWNQHIEQTTVALTEFYKNYTNEIYPASHDQTSSEASTIASTSDGINTMPLKTDDMYNSEIFIVSSMPHDNHQNGVITVYNNHGTIMSSMTSVNDQHMHEITTELPTTSHSSGISHRTTTNLFGNDGLQIKVYPATGGKFTNILPKSSTDLNNDESTILPTIHVHNEMTTELPVVNIPNILIQQEEFLMDDPKWAAPAVIHSTRVQHTQESGKSDLPLLPSHFALYQKCRTTYDCTLSIPYSVCDSVRRICVCQPYHVAYNNTMCLPPSLLGYGCFIDAQCQVKVRNSICDNGICGCKAHHLPYLKHQCLPPVRVGEYCIHDYQCTYLNSYSYCEYIIPRVYGRCNCPLGYKISEDKTCLPSLGSKCNKHTDCHLATTNSNCQIKNGNALCACMEGFAPSQNLHECTLIKPPPTAMISLGKACKIDEECQARDPYSHCLNGICECIAPDSQCSATNRGCYEDSFQCRNGFCISWFFVCDGNKNCADGSDETECIRHHCPKTAFTCDDGTCLSRAVVCNGRWECPDGSDEARCYTGIPCDKNAFRCRNGQCLPSFSFCNSIPDCADGSDELTDICHMGNNCTEVGFHQCNNGHCRSTAMLCSDIDGCGDNSDEDRCDVCYCKKP